MTFIHSRIIFFFHSNDTEKYTQLQYSLIVDENTSLKDLEELLIQALVYRFMVFAYEVCNMLFYALLSAVMQWCM